MPIVCPACSTANQDGAVACTNCGAAIAQQPPPAAPAGITAQPLNSISANKIKGVKGASITSIIIGVIDIAFGFWVMMPSNFILNKTAVMLVMFSFGAVFTTLGIVMLYETRLKLTEIYIYVLLALVIVLLLISLSQRGHGPGLLSWILAYFLSTALMNINKLKKGQLK